MGKNDILFVRKGFGLEKIINAGVVTSKKIQVDIKAQVVFYENGAEIEKVVKF